MMKELGKDWLTEPAIDYEYKKYLLLAYIQQAEQELELLKLYPTSSDALLELDRMQAYLACLMDNKTLLPKELMRFDLKTVSPTYNTLYEAPEALQVITSIAEYAEEQLTGLVDKACQLREELENLIALEPIGVLPVKPEFGYLFIEQPKAVEVFEYEITHVASTTNELYRIKTSYYNSYSVTLTNTYSSIKTRLIKTGTIANPGTFLVRSDYNLPVEETLLPLAKNRIKHYL